ncbi:MAG: phage major capsid protein, partial [Beijerinckiaceae bacterium]
MTDTPIETKAVGDDVGQAFAEFSRAFDAFRETNDDRLGQIERRMSADVITEEKLTRIDRAVDEAKARIDALTLKSRRPALGASAAEADEGRDREHRAAFAAYMRGGDAAALVRAEAKGMDQKAMSVGSGPDGGYLAPAPAERELLSRMAAISPIRAIASVREISGGQLKKAFSTTGPAAGWAGEVAARPQTASPNLADLTFPAMELYAMPSATQTLLDDAAIDLEQWIADEAAVAFAEKEGQAFVAGDGVDKPKGFLSYTNVANNVWSWGNLGYLATGVSGAFPASNSSDMLMDLIYSLKGGHRQNATFVMNRATQASIRKFKDGQGNYLWHPPAGPGASATLMTFPIAEAEDMPAIGANSFAIAFGDFRRGYLVVDRMGVRILRDPYSAKPYVLFYVTKRVGGGVQDFEAIKLLK